MDHPAVTDLPYDERRIIVVADKLPAAVARSSEGEPDILQVFGRVARTGWLGAGGFAAVILLDQMKRFKDDGEAIHPISWETARALRFPPGHPRKNVVYIGHPVDAGSYIPAADFHRFLFEHKVAEALRLIRSLGATTIQVLHIEGWDSRAAAKLGLGLPQALAEADIQANAEASRTEATSRQVLAEMKLTPTGESYMPTDLVWIAHEPLWAEVAAARIESGLNEFVIDVRSTDDFGVNAGLKLLIQKTRQDWRPAASSSSTRTPSGASKAPSPSSSSRPTRPRRRQCIQRVLQAVSVAPNLRAHRHVRETRRRQVAITTRRRTIVNRRISLRSRRAVRGG